MVMQPFGYFISGIFSGCLISLTCEIMIKAYHIPRRFFKSCDGLFGSPYAFDDMADQLPFKMLQPILVII